ncbi:hypothetical protein EHI8A_138260 [Entamoeba histolytica HM-1:IMSS-B]|uniref:Uncharacterized protein n=6 Tax=Entamoeba histolytica TaxID=5759 RepID=C4M8Q2_ENTH1|nr:hypothetical protein EHI_132390 [Entamoeba histolytica HM-1:IMSS]EMD47800.1 Hypothetical protein EHI5A_072710 [Entamoeba histolytica KU27]EMH74984.1 hypothetical protein EHI8A_138260 [Entamoeba histolytica HM-1:IMSS-B]EMS14055.1 hypothetical protein KM1_064570 [Entamoeba histolytica HM-3:IMSS]ENY59832.1 hypothetical protein EHI7A_040130 [Entamoeba histolytica HM-1:IMSS-A]GAT97992.1 hypothetical protein CL6EHI_132390 [Entamoeba histolytica]|eukprot:XP_649491.1 hypothetical protein EHI_132390 [Entamoeba histolytica HM-1:IMSS]
MSLTESCKISNTPRRKEYNDLKYIIKKKVIKDLECYQESILIALLNQFCGITICRPRKQCSVALCCAKVQTIHVNSESIEVMKLAEQRFKPIYDQDIKDGIAKATSFRRFEKNKRIFVHNFLFDLALEFGFFFDSKLSRKSTKTDSIERIQRVYFRGKLIIELEEVVEKGSILTNQFFDLVRYGVTYTLNKNDQIISKVFSHLCPVIN